MAFLPHFSFEKKGGGAFYRKIFRVIMQTFSAEFCGIFK
jgi:hypothetical protein